MSSEARESAGKCLSIVPQVLSLEWHSSGLLLDHHGFLSFTRWLNIEKKWKVFPRVYFDTWVQKITFYAPYFIMKNASTRTASADPYPTRPSSESLSKRYTGERRLTGSRTLPLFFILPLQSSTKIFMPLDPRSTINPKFLIHFDTSILEIKLFAQILWLIVELN